MKGARLLLFSILIFVASVTARQQHHLHNSCGRHPLVSCSKSALESTNSCCVENKSGLILLSQFWDVRAGYKDAWTVHGLWTDYCTNGTWPQFCDEKRAYPNITQILQSLGEYELVQEMNNIWPNSEGLVDTFWLHEWSKHGTCMSTFEPKCYGGDAYQGMVDFFKSTLSLHKRYNIYKALERHHIVPGHSYPTKKLVKAIEKELKVTPNLQCDKDGNIVEAWIYFHVRGPIKNLDVVPTLPDSHASCNNTLHYPVKYAGEKRSGSIW
ncbi:ribonuclease T2-like [Apophysomyces ossiformis]|uniref:ribonuclease T2 n=1 Tax=Apophysomyces ossiformis TaxID=679940 RepID=A0A8H7BTD1_9FUNG|nr:ribonuclease T2-like [Apophysomyces ossiformis]